MNKPKGFRVGLKEREVILSATQDGQTFKLKHLLKQPSSQDWLDYERGKSKVHVRGRKSTVETTIIEAGMTLYDNLIISVEGYDDVSGKPLTPEISDWKEKIPAIHKTTVIDTFCEVSADNGEDDAEKN